MTNGDKAILGKKTANKFLWWHDLVFCKTAMETFSFTLTDHKTHLSIGASSIGYDVECAKRAPVVLQTITSLNPTHSIWLLLRITCLPLQHRSQSTPTLPSLSNNDSECSCYSGNKPAKTQEETTHFLHTHIVFPQLYFYQDFRNTAQISNGKLFSK